MTDRNRLGSIPEYGLCYPAPEGWAHSYQKMIALLEELSVVCNVWTVAYGQEVCHKRLRDLVQPEVGRLHFCDTIMVHVLGAVGRIETLSLIQQSISSRIFCIVHNYSLQSQVFPFKFSFFSLKRQRENCGP